MRLISILVLSLCAVTASGKDAPAVPVVNDPAIVKAMTIAARALLDSVKGEPEFAERLRNYSMEDKLLLTFNDGRRNIRSSSDGLIQISRDAQISSRPVGIGIDAGCGFLMCR